MALRLAGGTIAELIGPAGSGKTTLLEALAERNPDVLPTPEPSRLELLPFYARHAALLLPTGLSRPRAALAFQEREARAMTYARAWHAPAEARAQAGRHVLMDHGPLFRLAFLDEFGTPLTHTPAFRRWWEGTFSLWEGSLDLLIRLNAPDDVLVKRVRGRRVGHALKSKTPVDARRFLGRYRDAFDRVIDRFAPATRPRELQIDTSRASIEEVADLVQDALVERNRAA
jgi:adenylate kinase family enzyme